MKRALWIAQYVAGIFFIYMGIMHFVVPEGLPETFAWMYDLSDPLHLITGTLELLGGIGLILPAVTRIQPRLVPMAAAGLALVMVGAVVYHLTRGEAVNVVSNLFWIAITGFIAYGRTVKHPIEPRHTGHGGTAAPA